MNIDTKPAADNHVREHLRPAGNEDHLVQLVSLSRIGANVGDKNQIDGIVPRRIERQARGERVMPEPIRLEFGTPETNAATARELDRLTEALGEGGHGHLEIVSSAGGEQAKEIESFARQPGQVWMLSSHKVPRNLDGSKWQVVSTSKAAIHNPSRWNPASRYRVAMNRMLFRSLERGGAKVVLTTGVSHSVTDASMAKAVADRAAKGLAAAPEVDRDTVGVVLGGVDDKEAKPDRKTTRFHKGLCRLANRHPILRPLDRSGIRDFTPRQARRYAKTLLALETGGGRRVHFVVTDGPRTGTHDPHGIAYAENPHRTGKTNKVMQAFVDELKKSSRATVTELGFQYSQLPSALQPMYAAWKEAEADWKEQGSVAGGKPGRLYIDGASFSMLSESSDHLESVVANEMGMMDGNQRAEMSVRHEAGSVAVVTEGGALLPPRKPWPGPQPSAGDAGAEALAAVARDRYLSA